MELLAVEKTNKGGGGVFCLRYGAMYEESEVLFSVYYY